MFPYAIPSDVETRWRPFKPGEEEVAEVLIDDAADMIRARWADIDDRIAAGSLSLQTVVRVIAGMVRRAMMNRDTEGMTQYQVTTGPFSGGGTYTNPNNNLYLSADDILSLDGGGYASKSRMGWLV